MTAKELRKYTKSHPTMTVGELAKILKGYNISKMA